MELTIDCKVIYRFDLLLSKTCHCFHFPFVWVKRGIVGEIVWFGFGLVKTT